MIVKILKKKYIEPETLLLDIACETVIMQGTGMNDNYDDEEEMDAVEDGRALESLGSWSDIWK